MRTKLDRLLETLDPAKNLDQVSARVDIAMNSFRVESYLITQWKDFKEVMARFYSHAESNILMIIPPRKPHYDIDWGRTCRLLIQEYGPAGEKAAFEMVRTGKEGGLYAVLKTIARKMINEYSGNEIKARISRFWDDLSVDERFAACNEYVKKYGHLLPDEITEKNAVRIKANFMKVLEEHPRLIQRLRNSCK